jgi:uncharacterized protein (DUF58 family)
MNNSRANASILPKPWVNFLSRHLTLHRLFWLLVIASYVVAWSRGIVLLYGLTALFLAILLVSYVWPRWQLRRLEILVELPSNLQVNQTFLLGIRLKAKKPSYHLALTIDLPYFDLDNDNALLECLIDEAVVELKLTPKLRGEHFLKEVTITSSYPFGVYSVTRRLNLRPVLLLVRPQKMTMNIHDLLKIGVSPRPQQGHLSLKGGDDDYFALRDWRAGEGLRHVDWRASARRQNLVLKEFQQPQKPTWYFMVNFTPDFVLGHPTESTLEFAISYLLGMMHWLTEEGFNIQLVVAEKTIWQWQAQPLCRDWSDVYEALALVKALSEADLAEWTGTYFSGEDKTGVCVTVRLDTQPFVPILKGLNTHIDLVLVSQSFIHPLNQLKTKPNEDYGKQISIFLTPLSVGLGTLK